MDRHWLAVVVEDDDLKESTATVGTDVKVTGTLAHYADGVADCVHDVLIGNAVPTSVVRDLHVVQVTLPVPVVQVNLRKSDRRSAIVLRVSAREARPRRCAVPG